MDCTRTLLAAALLAAASTAFGQDATVKFTLTSADNGAKTNFAWEIGGAWTAGGVTFYDPNPPSSVVVGFSEVGLKVIDVESAPGMRYFIPAGGNIPVDFPDSFTNEFSGLNLGITATNLDTGASRSMSTISMLGFTANGDQGVFFNILIPGGQAGMLPVTNGQTVRISGTIAGSIDLAKPFSDFNEGFWTSSDYGFTQTLIIGNAAPIPEPSTYGLLLGGLALAGAAIRRRRK